MRDSPKGIVLAGVHRWQNSALEWAAPRPLLPIANRPVIEHVLSWLSSGGVRAAGVCANSDTKTIRRCLNINACRQLAIYYYEDYMPRGPAGCVKDAALGDSAEPLVVVEGTILPQAVDLERVLDAHATSNAAMTIVVAALRGGEGDNGAELTPVGIYVLARRALDHISESGYQDLKEGLIPALYDAGERVCPYLVEAPVPRITDADTCLAANEWAVEQFVHGSPTEPGWRREGDALIHESASVDQSARFIGPVLVGAHSSVGSEVTIVGPTTIGAGCMISRGALVCRSLLWPSVSVGPECIVDRCILTCGTDVKATASAGNTVCTSR